MRLLVLRVQYSGGWGGVIGCEAVMHRLCHGLQRPISGLGGRAQDKRRRLQSECPRMLPCYRAKAGKASRPLRPGAGRHAGVDRHPPLRLLWQRIILVYIYGRLAPWDCNAASRKTSPLPYPSTSKPSQKCLRIASAFHQASFSAIRASVQSTSCPRL